MKLREIKPKKIKMETEGKLAYETERRGELLLSD
jgi:hypothetical protein